MDPSERGLIFLLLLFFFFFFFNFCVCVTKEARAGPITGEIGSPFGEDAAGCKGLNKGDFIDCAPLDLVIFLQPVPNRPAAGSPCPARTEGIALPAPARLSLAAPSSRAAPALELLLFFLPLLLSLGFVSFFLRPR